MIQRQSRGEAAGCVRHAPEALKQPRQCPGRQEQGCSAGQTPYGSGPLDRWLPDGWYPHTAHSLLLRAKAWQKSRPGDGGRSEEHTSELQSRENLVCRLLLEKKNR